MGKEGKGRLAFHKAHSIRLHSAFSSWHISKSDSVISDDENELERIGLARHPQRLQHSNCISPPAALFVFQRIFPHLAQFLRRFFATIQTRALTLF